MYSSIYKQLAKTAKKKNLPLHRLKMNQNSE